MVKSALQRVPIEIRPEIRVLTVEDLPLRVAANSNVEIEIAESFAQKFLRVGGKILGHAFFYAQFLEFEGDTPHRLQVVDQPPQGQSVPQWLAEMDEAIRVAAEIGNKQAEILRHHMNGQAHLARRAEQELNQLMAYAQTIQNSSGTPMTDGALKMVASADGVAAPSATNSTALSDENQKYLDGIRHEALGNPHLSIQELTELLRAIDDALSGKRSVVDIAARVYELRRDITAHSGRRDPLLSSVQTGINSALRRNTPNHLGFDFDYGTPSFDQLLANANFDLNDIVFTTQPSLRDDINVLHQMGKSIWLISLADGIQSEHIDTLTDGNTYALHDYFHLLEWFSVPLQTRQYAATLYTLISPIVEAHRIADRFDLYLDRLVELGDTYQLMKLVVKFPVHIIDGLLADRHSVIPAIYHALKNHNWSGPYATQQRDATTQALSALQIEVYTPTAQSVAAILKKNPSQIHTAEGMTYPRIEELVAHLIGSNASAHVVERGPGEYADLARRLAPQHRVTLVDERIILENLRDPIAHFPTQVRANIELVDMKSKAVLHADLCIWIHPIPRVLLLIENEWSNEPLQFRLNLPVLGQDVVPGGYLVIQTEMLFDRGAPIVDDAWELIYEGTHMGFLAPSRFINSNVGRTIVLRRRE